MPCGDNSSDDTVYVQAEKILMLTRVACDLAAQVPKTFRDYLRKETLIWLEEHGKADRLRKRQEQAQREDAEARKEALKKLSPRERKLLGIH